MSAALRLQHSVCYVDEAGLYLGDRFVLSAFLRLDPARLMHPNLLAMSAGGGEFTLLAAPTPTVLWSALRALGRHLGGPGPGDQTLYLAMSCGIVARYIAFDDLPWRDTLCPCGDVRQALIRYTGRP